MYDLRSYEQHLSNNAIANYIFISNKNLDIKQKGYEQISINHRGQ
jgi:hypothetical protein